MAPGKLGYREQGGPGVLVVNGGAPRLWQLLELQRRGRSSRELDIGLVRNRNLQLVTRVVVVAHNLAGAIAEGHAVPAAHAAGFVWRRRAFGRR